jgi:hypothetical protein
MAPIATSSLISAVTQVSWFTVGLGGLTAVITLIILSVLCLKCGNDEKEEPGSNGKNDPFNFCLQALEIVIVIIFR